MKLKSLFRGIDVEIRGSKEIDILSLCTDSRKAAPGSLFIAKKGQAHSGSDYLEEATKGGAIALITPLYNPFLKVTQIIYPKPEELEAVLATAFYEKPSSELCVIGITGTKGKSTTSYLVRHLISNCGLIGTIETIAGNDRRPSLFTTPFPVDIQKLLREIKTKGGDAVAMEVSSHGLSQGRVDGVEFDLAVFTNLSPDHLDFHSTFEEYAKAKKELFIKLDQSKKKNKRAILNGDHPWTSFMKEGIKTDYWTFGLGEKNDLRATDIQYSIDGTKFTLHFDGKTFPIQSPLLGKFNVYNALAALGVALHLGENIDRISSFPQVPGRMERVKNDRGIWAFVDFAHTKESLQNVLEMLKEFIQGKIILVFGAGGDRDPNRRFSMGKVASELADISIITSDNPRSEDPLKICQEIESMFSPMSHRQIIVDRKSAIEKAVQIANQGDAILVAGKGHEKVQIFGRQTIPFDDVEVLESALL